MSLTGSLVVTVVDAKDINSDQFGKVDPYCKLSLPGLLFRHRFRTRAHKRGGNAPIWEEDHTFHLNGTRPDTKLKISLYDHALFKKKPIGRAQIFLTELLEHRGQKQYYPILETDRPDFRIAGYIGLIVDFFDEERKSKFAAMTHTTEAVPNLKQSQTDTQSTLDSSRTSQTSEQQQQQQQQQQQPFPHPQMTTGLGPESHLGLQQPQQTQLQQTQLQQPMTDTQKVMVESTGQYQEHPIQQFGDTQKSTMDVPSTMQPHYQSETQTQPMYNQPHQPQSEIDKTPIINH